MNKLRNLFQNNKTLTGTLLFAAFMLIQLVTLRMSNQAGSGYLETEQQENVYLFIQIIVILGFLLHALLHRLTGVKTHARAGYAVAVAAVLGILAVGAGIMLFAFESSAFYLAVTGVSDLCLGFIIGAVYLKLSGIIADGARAGACIGCGYAAAVALQYAFQLHLTLKPVLALLLLLSLAVLAVILPIRLGADKMKAEQDKKASPRSRLIFSVIITLAMFVFTHYYNSYIHQLQVESGYTDYNVYSWPRLLMIPAVLLFGLIGDIKGGKFLPISALCVVVSSLFNTAVLGRETYLLNMCLYYISLTAVVVYYHLTFLRLAPQTGRPALWAAMGRLLDSLFVILSFGLKLSQLSLIAVLIIDIAALAVTVVFMAVNGDFNFSKPPEPIRIVETVTVPVPVPAPKVDPFPIMQEEYGITPKETEVLRELVATSDKQEIIAERLGISVSTLKKHITSIYRKTGVKSRAALTQLAENKRQA